MSIIIALESQRQMKPQGSLTNQSSKLVSKWLRERDLLSKSRMGRYLWKKWNWTVVSTYICIQVYVHQQIHAQSSYTYIHTKILVKTMKRKKKYYYWKMKYSKYALEFTNRNISKVFYGRKKSKIIGENF